MADLKSRVLAGVNVVFSGVVPLGIDIQNHDLGIWAKSFGATVSENISRRTTHLIASPDRRTAKVRQAAKKGGKIAIVNQNWLYAAFSQWRKVDEGPYRIHMEAPTNGKHSDLPDSFESKEFALSSSDEEAAQTEDETDSTATPGPAAGPDGAQTHLQLDTAVVPGSGYETDGEEWSKHSPTVKREDSSAASEQTPEDWDDIQDELADFLGSEAEDSETEVESVGSSVLSEGLVTPPSGSGGERKRKRDALGQGGVDPDGEGGDGAGEGDDGEEASRLQKRKKEALSRSSSLTNVVELSNGAVGQTSGDPGGGVEEHPDDEDDDLAAALAAELAEGDD